ncbi:MAG TPA: rhomboid family intramembrane serine protease, partial [Puia sp.]|nr:rhomboid family intramembrane serine protease [Puia sp.]
TAVGFIIVYTFLHWLLFIKWELFKVKEDIIDFICPFILSFIAALTWLRKRIKLLQLKRKRGDSTFGFQMLAALAIAAPVVIAQKYLETASGKLTQLSSVEDIAKHPATKYYEFKNYFIDTAGRGIALTSDVSGKYNRDLNLHIFISCPMYDSLIQPTRIGTLDSSENLHTETHPGPLYVVDNMIVDISRIRSLAPDSVAEVQVLKGVAARSVYGSAGSNGVIIIRTKNGKLNLSKAKEYFTMPSPKAWCCVQFSKTIGNRLSNEEKEDRFHHFLDASMDSFHNKNFQTLTYLQRTGFNDNLAGFKKAIKKTHLANDSSAINILEPEFGNFSDRNGHSFVWIFASLGIASIVWFAMLLGFRFDDHKLEDFHAGNPEKEKGDFTEMASLCIPRKGYYTTPVIVDLNILVFLIMVIAGLGFISFNSIDLLHWGANYKPRVLEGQWWRIVASMFLHGGMFHLASNMLALVFVGAILEPVLGSGKLAIFYVLTGVCASLSSIWWYDATASVGASGAIFGLYGIFTALLLSGVFPKALSKNLLITMSLFIGYNLIMGLNGGIDNAAHIGGLVSGLIVGYFVAPDLQVIQPADAEVNINS